MGAARYTPKQIAQFRSMKRDGLTIAEIREQLAQKGWDRIPSHSTVSKMTNKTRKGSGAADTTKGGVTSSERAGLVAILNLDLDAAERIAIALRILGGTMRDAVDSDVRAIAERLWPHMVCLLCGAGNDDIPHGAMGPNEAYVPGVFITKDKKFEVPEGKERSIPYILCHRCYHHGEANTQFRSARIEFELVKMIQEGTMDGYVELV